MFWKIIFIYFICHVNCMIWYASNRSEDGLVSGSGSYDEPWSLNFALSSHSLLKPGDTLLLLSGIYRPSSNRRGRFVCKGLSGLPNEFITIRSAISANQVVLDGAMNTNQNSSPSSSLTNSIQDNSDVLRIMCPFTKWIGITIQHSNYNLLKPTLHKNSNSLKFKIL